MTELAEELKERIVKIRKGVRKEAKGEKCHYCLLDDFEEEIGEFKVMIEGEMKRVHRRCYDRHLAGESNIRIIIR